MLAINNGSCFARVSGTHLWEIGLGQKFKSSTSDLGKEEWQEERSEVELWGFRLMPTYHYVSCLMT